MKKRFFPLLMILIAAVPAGLCAQSIPYVSQIKAETSNNLIRLTWADSPNAQGSVFVFRSPRPFGGTVPPNSRPVTVPYGTREYVDDIDTLEIIHYFIAASDTSGQRFDVIIPNVNNIGLNRGEVIVLEDPPPAIITPTLEGISNLTAEQSGDRVIITFNSGTPRNTVVLYRSTQPISRLYDLLAAAIVQSGIRSPFTDYPPVGQPWYYAAVYEDELSAGNVRIIPDSNATIAAVAIYGSEDAQDMIRSTPLPYMTVFNAVPDSDIFWELQDRLPLGDDALKVLEDSHLPPKPPLVLKRPRAFAVDLQPPSSGEESALVHIVQEFFGKRDWDNACIRLVHYLSRPLPEAVEARARFYLGQTLYFTGKYQEALFEFLAIKTLYPVEANLWIDAVLTAMVY